MAERAAISQRKSRDGQSAVLPKEAVPDRDVATLGGVNARPPEYRLDPRAVIRLQRSVGNQGVNHLLREQRAVRPPVASEPPRATAQPPMATVSPAQSFGTVQRVIATQPADLLNGAPGTLNGRLTNIGVLITNYNVAAQNMGIAQHTRLQQQFNLLRQLRAAIYDCLDQISQTTLELSDDPIGKRLHTLHGEADEEHRTIVDMMHGNPGLINQVTPFDATGLAGGGQLNAAKGLWTSLMTGAGKVKMVGDAGNQRKVRSWMTQLMDTPHGRAILENLDTPNNGRGATALDEMTNVYIGQHTGQMPGTVTGDVGYNPNMKNATTDAQAQPLKDVTTTPLDTRAGGAANYNAVTNPNEFVDEVLAGNAGVAMNGAEYDFNAAGSGAFVNMEESAHLPTVTSTHQLMAGGGMAKTEAYMPDWLLLGHELGHAVNMRAGSATNGSNQFPNATMEAFADQWSGLAAGPRRQNWYGGSEEYINIIGNENRLRAQGGLDPRGGHTSPKGPKYVRRGQAISQALDAATWVNNLGPAGHALQAEYNTVNTHVTTSLNKDSTQVQYQDLLQKATRFNQFVNSWISLENAHGNASKGKRFKWWGWWKAAKRAQVGIGGIIVNNNAASFTTRRQKLITLRNRY